MGQILVCEFHIELRSYFVACIVGIHTGLFRKDVSLCLTANFSCSVSHCSNTDTVKTLEKIIHSHHLGIELGVY